MLKYTITKKTAEEPLANKIEKGERGTDINNKYILYATVKKKQNSTISETYKMELNEVKKQIQG